MLLHMSLKMKTTLRQKKRENYTLEELKQTWLSKIKENCIFISAKEKENIEVLKQLIYDKVKEIHIQRFPPYNDFFYTKYLRKNKKNS